MTAAQLVVTVEWGGAELVTEMALSKATMRNIRQNLEFAFGYNALGLPIAAGVLYPVLGWRLSPMIAAAAMADSSLSVVTNANRLRRFHPTAGSPDRSAGVAGDGLESRAGATTRSDQPGVKAS